MSGEGRVFDVFLVRYVPNILEDQFVNIGVLLAEHDESGYADSRFLRDWQHVRSLDPDADVRMLEALTREIADGWKQPSERAALRRRMLRSFSNAIQFSLEGSVVTEHPAEELEHLESILL